MRRSMKTPTLAVRVRCVELLAASAALAEDYFPPHLPCSACLTDVYYSEGATDGDINHDGVNDAVYGLDCLPGRTTKPGRKSIRRIAAELKATRTTSSSGSTISMAMAERRVWP